ncbi:ribulose-5-phosphate 4-epimerase/fuculose-1-phosphate aldolase [Labrenzia sp. EL_142]|nr:ribulose-5-phosphate 4-epimerase/fuculose-1-phosphate aldolase [Labrenzia sp. EL_142]MBG6210966.1 ribulose-5-phosphate 4-epimerase/fuculose-1-phosphate aldolase [Labrenzia sp. EL_126]
MTRESHVREQIVSVAASLYERGYTHGSTGNISVPVEDGLLVTPTGSSFGDLDPARLSKLDKDGRHISGDQPTKECFLHRSVYKVRTGAGAVIHLHGTYSVAFSCLPAENATDALPKLTAYSHMQCGCVALLPYFRPGDERLADAVGTASKKHWTILLAHHGPVVAGQTLKNAMYATEELEQTARLALMLRGLQPNILNADHIYDLDCHFPPWRS